MKKQVLLTLVFSGIAMILFAQTGEEAVDALKGPYVGQLPPVNHSVVFAPGFISTEAGELNSVFCRDGNEFYFSRRGLPGVPSILMVTKRIDDSWTKPAPVGFSGTYNDIDLFLTPDGKSLVFCSRRPHANGENEKADHDFWISERDGDGWHEPVLFAIEANSEYEDFYPVVTATGNLYFNSQRGGQRGNNIYCSRYQDGKYTAAEKLPEPVNSDYWEFDAYVDREEHMMLFSSTRPGGYGGSDIYMSVREADGRWTEPKNLGPEVNSPAYEYGTSISPDGEYLFYTSTRNGSEDIYWISTDILDQDPVTVSPAETIPQYGEIFMDHFIKNWDDIHDVIMRYHYEDPGLKGLVTINMTWRQGRLADAGILENTTGDTAYGRALVEAMKKWSIPEITGGWSSAVPIRTAIKGSQHPEFNECGILTGKITDRDGKPVSRAMLVLEASESPGDRSDTLYTNREGIYIQTLVPPGTWKLTCSKPGYETTRVENIAIEKGQHRRQAFIIEAAGSVKDR